jgi:hypothetical protein
MLGALRLWNYSTTFSLGTVYSNCFLTFADAIYAYHFHPVDLPALAAQLRVTLQTCIRIMNIVLVLEYLWLGQAAKFSYRNGYRSYPAESLQPPVMNNTSQKI